MKQFAQLYAALDATTKTAEKIAAMAEYFAHVPPADGAWAVYLLSGRRRPQIIPTRKLSQWASELADVPDWLFGECYDAVGDLAETISLILPEPERDIEGSLAEWVEQRLESLRGAPELIQRSELRQAWLAMSPLQRLVLNKIITGAFRVGVSQRLVVRGLERAFGISADVLEHRLMGNWRPSPEFFDGLRSARAEDVATVLPYPFLLAHPLDVPLDSLGDIHDWQLEWKWDGIRAQIVRRGGDFHIWSRGEELVTDRFPELHPPVERLPLGVVLDGEIVAWTEDRALPFAVLQKRIGRRSLGPRILAEAPVAFLAFDLLEFENRDQRAIPLAERRQRLEQLLAPHGSPRSALRLAPLVAVGDWNEAAQMRATSRLNHTEGLMIKRRSSLYGVGRPRGDWWKWKIDPYTIDAVLVYAQRGSGKRASLFTDYTFAVWDGPELVPFAKAYSGLTDDEIREVDRFIRQHTRERHGPVRVVEPQLVFELAFESIQRSTRHRSGVAVRFPRIARWRHDKKPSDADTLEQLVALIAAPHEPPRNDPPGTRYLWD